VTVSVTVTAVGQSLGVVLEVLVAVEGELVEVGGAGLHLPFEATPQPQ